MKLTSVAIPDSGGMKVSQEASEVDEFWGIGWPYGPPQPPATHANLLAWEEMFGLRLPSTLAAALGIQNGGSIRGTDILVCPLSAIVPLTGERWAHLWEYETHRAFGLPARLVLFGAYEEVAGSLVLNYNAASEPRVIALWHDLGDELQDRDDGTFDELILASRERHR